MLTAAERKRNFEREQLTRHIQMTVGISLLGITAFLVTVIFGGNVTAPLRDFLGLSYFISDQDGVYADCSLAENRNNKFCRSDYSSTVRRPTPSAKFWQKPGSGPAFSLSGD